MKKIFISTSSFGEHSTQSIELLDSMGVYMSDMDSNGNINILDIIQIINVILDQG